MGNMQKKRGGKKSLGEYQILQMLELYQPFHEWIGEMRKKYEIRVSIQKGLEGYCQWREDQYEIWEGSGFGELLKPILRNGECLHWDIAWHDDIELARERFRLSRNYHEALEYYLVTGSFEGAAMKGTSISKVDKKLGIIEIRIVAPFSKEEFSSLGDEVVKIMRKRWKEGRNIDMRWEKDKNRPKLDRDINLLRLSLLKNKKDKNSPIANDRDIAARLFSDDDSPFESFGEMDRRNAKIVGNARRRLRNEIEKRFGIISSQGK
jgi:hypothetical protein